MSKNLQPAAVLALIAAFVSSAAAQPVIAPKAIVPGTSAALFAGAVRALTAAPGALSAAPTPLAAGALTAAPSAPAAAVAAAVSPARAAHLTRTTSMATALAGFVPDSAPGAVKNAPALNDKLFENAHRSSVETPIVRAAPEHAVQNFAVSPSATRTERKAASVPYWKRGSADFKVIAVPLTVLGVAAMAGRIILVPEVTALTVLSAAGLAAVVAAVLPQIVPSGSTDSKAFATIFGLLGVGGATSAIAYGLAGTTGLAVLGAVAVSVIIALLGDHMPRRASSSRRRPTGSI